MSLNVITICFVGIKSKISTPCKLEAFLLQILKLLNLDCYLKFVHCCVILREYYLQLKEQLNGYEFHLNLHVLYSGVKLPHLYIFIQVRAKLSTFGGFGGPSEVTCGGNALKFYASIRLNIKRIGHVKKGEEVMVFIDLLIVFACSIRKDGS